MAVIPGAKPSVPERSDLFSLPIYWNAWRRIGIVYKAEDTRLHPLVALKLLPEGIAKDPQSLARFEPEAHSESLITTA